MFPPLGSVQGVDPDTTVTLLGNGGFTTYEGCDPVSYVWKDSAGNEIADGTSVTITGDEGDEVVYYAATVDACGNKSNYATNRWVIAEDPVTVTAPINADGTTSSTVEATEGTDVTITPTGGTTSDVACDPVTYEFTAPDGTVTTGSTITVVAPDAGTIDTYSVRTLDSCGNTSPVAEYNVEGIAVVVTAPTNASTVEATEGDSVTFTPVGGTTSSTNCEPVTYEFTAPDGAITTGASLTVTAPASGTTDTYSVKTVDACGNTSPAVSYGVTGLELVVCDSEGTVEYISGQVPSQDVYWDVPNAEVDPAAQPQWIRIKGTLDDGSLIYANMVITEVVNTDGTPGTAEYNRDNNFNWEQVGLCFYDPDDNTIGTWATNLLAWSGATVTVTTTFDRPINGVLAMGVFDKEQSELASEFTFVPPADSFEATASMSGFNYVVWNNMVGTTTSFTSALGIASIGFMCKHAIELAEVSSGTYCCVGGNVTYKDADGSTIDASLVLDPVTC